MNLVFICDNNYALPTRTAINSVIKNKKQETELKIYIIGVELNEQNKNSFYKFNMPNVKIIFLEQDDVYKNLGPQHKHVSKAALLKFNIPQLINEERILYLDGDIIVSDDLSDLYHTDISEYYAAVIQDYFSIIIKEDNNRIETENYFNSGVMLLNLAKMRKDNISENLLTYKRNQKDIYYMDQDAFNYIFDKKVIFLNYKYNFLNKYEETEQEIFKNIKPVIVHYADSKPWNNINATNAELWLQYVLPEDLGYVLKNYFHNLNIDVLQNINETIEQLQYQNKRLDEKIKKMQKSKISASCKRLLKKLFYKNKNNKKKFRLFGIPLFSLKKQPGKKVFKILGLKFSFKEKVDEWGGGKSMVEIWLSDKN